MSRLLSLAYLTAASLAPPEAVRLAAKLGYDAIGVRVAPITPGGGFAPLIEDKVLREATRGAIAETGVGVFDVEIVRIAADFDAAKLLPFLETCAALGARAILVAGDDPEQARLTQSFAAFCAAAAPFGLTADLEFMPWTKTPNANAALRIVEGAGAANGRVLVDALHFARSATSLDDIAALPAARLSYAQICDAPAEIPDTVEGLIHTARLERLLPGEGGIDIVSLFARLPAALPVSVEVPNEKGVAAFGAEEWARRALETTKRQLTLAERA
jgi:sugar phosphate isomerase/epimerase